MMMFFVLIMGVAAEFVSFIPRFTFKVMKS